MSVFSKWWNSGSLKIQNPTAHTVLKDLSQAADSTNQSSLKAHADMLIQDLHSQAGISQSPQIQSSLQNPYYGAGLASGMALGGLQQAAHSGSLSGPLSSSQTQQLQNYQQQINHQMQQIIQSQQQMAAQSIFTGKSIIIDGEKLNVSDSDYEFIISAGYQILKKREEYRSDFDKLIDEK